MRRAVIVESGLILVLLVGSAGPAGAASARSGSHHLARIDPRDYSAKIDNPYLPWKPGTLFRYHTSHVGTWDIVYVTHRTKKIAGVTCVVVRDVTRTSGQPESRAFDWYAQDKVGNVWYFGEASSTYKNGRWVFAPDDSWKSGVRRARPGIMMEADPRKGDRYRQETARRDGALDTGKVEGYRRQLSVPYGTFHHVLSIREFSPLEPGSVDRDLYARGIGQLREVNVNGGSGFLELDSIRQA
jgi:hypothetical protein